MDTYQLVDNRIVDVSEMTYFRIVYGGDDFAELSAAVAEHAGTQLMKGDQLLTLSTCNGNASQRYVILCKKVGTEQEGTETEAKTQTEHMTEDAEKAQRWLWNLIIKISEAGNRYLGR